jgi:uncharacterized membrane protein YGL010W
MAEGDLMPGPTMLLSAAVDLSHPGRYLDWGVVQISAANAIVIALMVVVFVLALLLPFPGGRRRR